MKISEALLKTQGLGLYRGGRWLWHIADIVLNPTEIVLISGGNGSGKTSLLKVLVGLIEPTVGDFQLTRPIAYLGHVNGLYPEKTPIQYLKADEALAFWQLTNVRDVPIFRLSCGQQRRLALARVALSGRRVWILDEPTAGLDVQGQNFFWQMIQRHQAQGGAVVMTHHTTIPLSAHINVEL